MGLLRRLLVGARELSMLTNSAPLHTGLCNQDPRFSVFEDIDFEPIQGHQQSLLRAKGPSIGIGKDTLVEPQRVCVLCSIAGFELSTKKNDDLPDEYKDLERKKTRRSISPLRRANRAGITRAKSPQLKFASYFEEAKASDTRPSRASVYGNSSTIICHPSEATRPQKVG